MTAAEQLRNEGREEAQRENLRLLLSLRFGTLSGRVLARIHRADFAQIQSWFKRGATAPDLDAVFADEP